MARRKLWKGLVAGAAAGLAASLAMTQFQNGWSKLSEKLSGDQNEQSSGDEAGEQSEDATMKAAGKLAAVAGRELTHDQKKKAGPIVHYAFGTGMGALYGAAMEFAPHKLRRHDLLSGVSFGGLLFGVADEIAVPAAGLSKSAKEVPLSSHFLGLASHVVYGLTTGAVRKAVRAAV